MTETTTPVLAVIGFVDKVDDIAGADRIKLATVDCGNSGSWNGVVGLDIHAGELVTVFLQDALLTPDPRWDFMAKHKYRVRMARFKGVPSECVIVPLINGPMADALGLAPCIGADLTAELGVTKYSKPVPAEHAGEMKNNFPSNIPRTDEENFQRLNHQALMHDCSWRATEKADGTSCTAWVDDDGLHVCSRNWELKEFTNTGAGNLYWQAARKYDLTRLPPLLALQFEVIGPGIQGNPMGLAETEIRAFTLHDMLQHRRLPYVALLDLCNQMRLPMARLVTLGFGPLDKAQLQALAQISYPNGQPGEGIVIRAHDARWSMKVINLLYQH